MTAEPSQQQRSSRLGALAIIGGVVLLVIAVVVAVRQWQDGSGPEATAAGTPGPPTPRPTPEAAAAAPAPTPAATPSTAPSEEPSAEPTEPTEPERPDPAPGTTAIFAGGPATGPWQRIGSIAEINHPEAGPVARLSYDERWRPEGLSDELWDHLVADASTELVTLGPPPDRASFGEEGGSTDFSAAVGVHWTDEATEGRGIVIGIDAVFVREDDAQVWATWNYLVDLDTEEVLDEMPRIQISDQDVDSLDDAMTYLNARTGDWVFRRPPPG